MKKAKYFKLQELVSKKVYDKYGESAWRFIDERLIETMDLIREHFGKPVTINNWYYGGDLSQRGLRCNMDQIVKDSTAKNSINISAHTLGKAADFNIKGMSSKQIVAELKKNEDKFKHIRRIEDPDFTPTWVHIDLNNDGDKGIKIFKP